MKKITIALLTALSIITPTTAAKRMQAIRNLDEYSARSAFENRRQSLANPAPLDSVLSEALDPSTRNALIFLYAYMPLHDLASNSFSFFRQNVEQTLKAREEMPWGEIVPQREFRHFVLPLRVNNEDLDMSRIVFFDELKDRVKGLSMTDAVRAVNHWCHEKVTYRPSDARTSPPLSSVSQAIGRCGEESTFTVAALRSVGIPARQVYTPRWAHTDDNHAWVEAWADGKWHFLGACEPEPVLDLAWFNAPAGRGLMMALNVFGPYDGPEDVLYKDEATTRINVTSNYAAVAPLKVRVLDKNHNPVPDIDVRFGIYNYTEVYPVAVLQTDANGISGITAGDGDMIVWASDGKNYGFVVARPSADKVYEIILDKDSAFAASLPLDIVPPMKPGLIPAVTPEQRKENNLALAREDAIRGAYEKTFFSEESAREFLKSLNAPEFDTDNMVQNLVLARGNRRTMTEFLKGVPADMREQAVMLLTALPEKDLRDVRLEVLNDHLKGADNPLGIENAEIFAYYILSPRVRFESLTPWRTFFSEILTPTQKEMFRTNPQLLKDFVNENLATVTASNTKGLNTTPRAAWSQKAASEISRNIFFVAAARACGLPARIDEVTGQTQVLDLESGDWANVELSANDSKKGAEVAPKGELILTFEATDYIKDPRYFSHFGISKIEEGMPELLDYDGESYASLFAKPLPLDCGQYMLMTGRRMADGSVLANATFFNINENELTTVPLNLRNDDSAPSVIGSLNAENIYHDLTQNADKSLLSSTGRGYYALGIIRPNHEPTAHALNEISALAKELNETGRPLVLLFESADDAARFNPSAHGKLPDNTFIGIDNNNVTAKEIKESLNLPEVIDLPIFVVADTFNRIVYFSNGYSIGTAERLLNTLRQVEKINND